MSTHTNKYAILRITNFDMQDIDIPQMLVDIDVTVIAQEQNYMLQCVQFVLERSDFYPVDEGSMLPEGTLKYDSVTGKYSFEQHP